MSARRGLTLLEVLIALVLLALGAAGWLSLSAQSRWSAAQTRERESELRAASAQMALVSTWSAETFAQRIGASRTRHFLIRVLPLAPDLYSVELADTLTRRALLATTFYVRSDSASR